MQPSPQQPPAGHSQQHNEPPQQYPSVDKTTAFPVVGQPVSGQPVSGQPVSGQPIPGHPDQAQPVSGQAVGAQPGAQPAPGTYYSVPGAAAPQYQAAPAAPPTPRDRTGLRLSLGDALVGGGALLVFLFSFAPFVGYADADVIKQLEEENLPTWFSAWALETFMAPLTWWVIFAALGLVALVGLRFLLPKDRQIAGFRFSQIQIGLAGFAFLVLLGYALSAKTLMFGSELQSEVADGSSVVGDVSLGWGGILMLFGSLVALAGAVLDHLDIGPTVWPQPPKPAHPHGGFPQGVYQSQPGYPQGYPQSQPVYPQAPAGHPQAQPPRDYPTGQASFPPGQYPAQH